MSSLKTSAEDIARAKARAALVKQVEDVESHRVPSPRDAEADITRTLERAGLEEAKSRRVLSLLDLKGLKAFLYVSSNNQTFNVMANILSRSGLLVPENWVFDNCTSISIRRVSRGYVVEMINPDKVSNEKRFISKEVFNAALAESNHPHLAIREGTIVYLIRHGQARNNLPETFDEDARDANLTSDGIMQASVCGEAIAKHALELGVIELKVHTSDLIRTMRTADEIMQQFPEHMRPKTFVVCIEAREAMRFIGGKHNWEKENPDRLLAMDPLLSIDELSKIFPPGTDRDKMVRAQLENLPWNNPVDNPDECIKSIGNFAIDWSDYVQKVLDARRIGKSFGSAAAETLLLDVIISNTHQ
jgi:hypothetical protein